MHNPLSNFALHGQKKIGLFKIENLSFCNKNLSKILYEC